jgi:alpha-L-rhamnosidase
MFGEIGAWFYKGLGGIFPDPQNPGFKNIILKPNFVDALEHFEASHLGPYGKINSAWKKEGNTVVYTISIPANSSATLFLETVSILEPDKIKKSKGIKNIRNLDKYSVLEIESGEYTFFLN